MRFRVWRTSGLTSKEPPCDGAVADGKNKSGYPLWAVDIPDLDALLQFARDNGDELVLNATPNPRDSPIPTIEIYDDYRE